MTLLRAWETRVRGGRESEELRTMRKMLSLVVSATCGVLATAVPSAHGALTDYDGFDYAGTTLNGQAGGFGWNGGWFATGAMPSINLSNDATSLTYPATFEPPMSTPPSTGARVSTGGATANAGSSRLLATPLSLAVDGNVMYASALFRKNRPNGEVTTDNILLEFVDASANRRFGLGIEGTGDRPWLNANGSTSAANTVVAGETYLIVAKIVSSAAGTDSAFLKVYGNGYGSQVPVAEPTTWDATLTETTSAILDRIRIRIDPGNSGPQPGEIDDIRIGTDWQSVVSEIPEPSGLALIGLGALCLGARRRRQAAT
jgi:hypothetical protein